MLQVIDTIEPLGKFPVAKSKNIDFNGESLDEVLEKNTFEISNKLDRSVYEEFSRISKIQTSNSLIAAFFNDNSNVKLNFYKSHDGIKWNKINVPELSWIRDADIIYKDGAFLLTGTYNNRINDLTIFRSYNLVDWEDCSKSFGLIPTGMVSYAPEWFEDDNGDLYATLCIRQRTEGNLSYYDNYIVKCTNIETLEFSTPKILNLGNYNLIDTHITKKDGVYYLFAKTEHNITGQTDGQILIFTSDNLEQWTLTVNGIQSLVGYRYEGACVQKIGDLYYLYVDNYGGDDTRESRSYMHYCTSTDLINWSVPKCIMANDSTRHGTPRMISDGAADKVLNIFDVVDSNTVTYKELMPADNGKYLKIYQIIAAGGYRCAQIDFNLFDGDNKRFVANYKVVAQYSPTIVNSSVKIYEDIVVGTTRNLVFAHMHDNGVIDIYLKCAYNNARPIVTAKSIDTFSCYVVPVIGNTTIDGSELELIGPSCYPSQDNRLLNFYAGVLKDSKYNLVEEATKILNISTSATESKMKLELNGIYYMTFTALIYGRANGMKVDAFILIAQMTSDGTYANSKILNLGELDHEITTEGRDLTIAGLSTNAEYTVIASCSHGKTYKISMISNEEE